MNTLTLHDTFDPYVAGRKPFKNMAVEPEDPGQDRMREMSPSEALPRPLPQRPAGLIGPRRARPESRTA